MNHDLSLWYVARVAALTAFAALAGAVLTGVAIHTAYLAPIARNRAVTALHTFLTWFWVPLVVVHVVALVVDHTARIGVVDLVLPFQVDYGSVAIGLGTISFLLLGMTWVTSVCRRRMPHRLWQWLHRLTYPLFLLILVHAQLAGSDFSSTAVSVLGWATLGAIGLLAVPRLLQARMETKPAATPITRSR